MGCMINHTHLKEVDSTQSFLKNLLLDDNSTNHPILVSTEKQSNGVGRQGNKWHSFNNSLAFSFTLEPNKEITLSSLEIGALLVKFFSPNASLKWPNDLLTTIGEKCGGILCHVYNSRLLIFGIGINLTNSNHKLIPSKTPIGKLSLLGRNQHIQKSLPYNIYKYILDNRIEKKEVIELWSESCFHKNKRVSIKDGQSITDGIFKGIGAKGEAIVQKDNGELNSLYSGGLTF